MAECRSTCDCTTTASSAIQTTKTGITRTHLLELMPVSYLVEDNPPQPNWCTVVLAAWEAEIAEIVPSPTDWHLEVLTEVWRSTAIVVQLCVWRFRWFMLILGSLI
ncbi:hypothetical protein L195_g012332 [Trifolium pratense]|uniref:Uncharacterized protein n=1 Tax=Trifolium pratense TaxID=57577 RepID=A0A2K3PK07_TRIPR|nr:hypothetical protein L195_g012332 [Trifolium pratense]